MDVLRTPEERFADLPEFPFPPHYVEIADGDGGSLRMHHVEVGPGDGEVILCLHGEPSWSFLYRKMLPIFADAGYRAIAPDLIGFGRSDKPTDRAVYTYQRHLDWLQAWLDAVELRDITLVCQDWGGLLGLRLATADPDRFARLVVANTFLPTGDRPPSEAFERWKTYSQKTERFPIGELFQRSSTRDLAPEVIAAYDAPFPDERYKAGARQFPMLVPVSPDNPASQANREAWEVLKQWQKPVLTAFSDSDPIMRGGDKVFQKLVPGTAGQPHTTIEDAGHFLQEDSGEELAAAVLRFLEANR